MSENVGEIVYIIRADTAQLLNAGRDVIDMTEELQGSFDDTDDSADNLNTTLSKLAATIKLVFAAGALREAAQMVQSYQEMAERVQMATASQEEFERVQKRLLNTANGTYRSLSEAQELYIRSADGLRSMGYSTEQAIDVQDSMSYAFVKNAASADRADAAISAFTKSINTGKVAADQWETITTAIPTVINDIATASAKTAAEVRALGAAGKLTASDLSEGLRQSLSENSEAAASMSNNLTDASVRMKTAITAVLVAIEGQTGVLQGFTNRLITAADSILSLSEDSDLMAGYIDTATIAAKAFALVMAGRYVGALTSAAGAKLSAIAATRQQVLADSQAAQAAVISANATQRKAVVDKEAAISALNLAQAEYNVAKGTAAQTFALDALIAAKSRATAASIALTEAENFQAAATTRAAAAARAASVGFGIMRGALAFLGGPAGVIMIAAASLFYFYQKAEQAKEEAIAFADGIDKLNASLSTMNNTQLRGSIADANISIRAQQSAVDDLEDEVAHLTDRYSKFNPAAAAAAERMGTASSYALRQKEVFDELNQKTRDLADKKEKLAKTEATAAEANRLLTNNMLTSMGVHDQLIEKGTTLERVQGAVARAFGSTADEINRANQAGQNFNPKSLQIDPPTEEGDKIILGLEEQNTLLKIQDERLRAVTKARMEEAKVTKNANQINEAGRLAGENFDLQKSEEGRRKAQQESEQQNKRSASQAAAIATKLADMKRESELAADSTQELSREQQLLRAEMSLGAAATAEQKKQAREYKAAALDAAEAAKGVSDALKAIPEKAENKSYSETQKNLAAALKAGNITQQEYNTASEKMEQQHQTNLAKIRAQQTVSSQQESVALVDPVQQLANQHAQQISLIQQFEQQGVLAHQQALELKNAADTAYEQQRIAAQWEIFKNQSQANELLASSLDGLQSGASNAITGLLNGTQSLQESFANLGSTILNSVVSSLVEMGIQYVKSLIMGKAMSAAATASQIAEAGALATAWAPAAIAASIATQGKASAIGLTAYGTAMSTGQALSLAGGRRYGGNVSAGNAYRINENGESEIFQTAGGKQAFIPNQSGKIIPADKAGGGNSVVQHITFEINTTGGIDQATMKQMETMMKRVALFQIGDQANRPNGMIQPRRK